MATFPRGYWTKKSHHANTRLRNNLQGGPSQTIPGKITWLIEPVDMRGIPAIGRNCPGRIAGTRPDQIADRNVRYT